MTLIFRSPKFAISGIILAGVVGITASFFISNFTDGPDRQDIALSYPYPDPQNKDQVALGQKMYTEQCASCHGPNLAGQKNWRSPLADGSLPAPPHDQDGHTWHHPDGLLIRIIKFGGASVAPEDFNSGMPAFEDSLTDEEISATLAFIKSRWPKEIRMRQERVTAQSNKSQ